MSSVVTSLPVLPCPSSKRRLVMRDLDSIILIHDQSVFTCMFELLPCSVPCPSNFVSLLWDTGLFLAHYGIWIRSFFSNAEDGDCSTSMRSHSQNTSTLCGNRRKRSYSLGKAFQLCLKAGHLLSGL